MPRARILSVQPRESITLVGETSTLTVFVQPDGFVAMVATIHGLVEVRSEPRTSCVRMMHAGKLYARSWPMPLSSRGQGARLATAFASDVASGHVARWRGGKTPHVS